MEAEKLAAFLTALKTLLRSACSAATMELKGEDNEVMVQWTVKSIHDLVSIATGATPTNEMMDFIFE